MNLVLETDWCCMIPFPLPKSNDKRSPFSIEYAENCAKRPENAETYNKLWQFAGHGQNCKPAAKHENLEKLQPARSRFSSRTSCNQNWELTTMCNTCSCRTRLTECAHFVGAELKDGPQRQPVIWRTERPTTVSLVQLFHQTNRHLYTTNDNS